MKILIRIASMGISLVAGMVGTKAVSAIWHKATGEQPPTPAHPEAQQHATMTKVLLFAAISGASAACIQAITKRWTGQLEAKAR